MVVASAISLACEAGQCAHLTEELRSRAVQPAKWSQTPKVILDPEMIPDPKVILVPEVIPDPEMIPDPEVIPEVIPDG